MADLGGQDGLEESVRVVASRFERGGKQRGRFPDRELRDGEKVRVEVEWDNGYAYSSYTYEDPSFTIQVLIDKPVVTLVV